MVGPDGARRHRARRPARDGCGPGAGPPPAGHGAPGADRRARPPGPGRPRGLAPGRAGRGRRPGREPGRARGAGPDAGPARRPLRGGLPHGTGRVSLGQVLGPLRCGRGGRGPRARRVCGRPSGRGRGVLPQGGAAPGRRSRARRRDPRRDPHTGPRARSARRRARRGRGAGPARARGRDRPAGPRAVQRTPARRPGRRHGSHAAVDQHARRPRLGEPDPRAGRRDRQPDAVRRGRRDGRLRHRPGQRPAPGGDRPARAARARCRRPHGRRPAARPDVDPDGGGVHLRARRSPRSGRLPRGPRRLARTRHGPRPRRPHAPARLRRARPRDPRRTHP